MSDRHQRQQESDDEDEDEDYVPPPECEGSDSDSTGTPSAKRPKVDESVQGPADPGDKALHAERAELWARFKASASQEQPKQVQKIAMVRVVKTMRYAGEDIKQIIEVPEDSPDARAWSRFMSSAEPESRIEPSNGTPATTTMPPLPPNPAPAEPRGIHSTHASLPKAPQAAGRRVKKTLGDIPSTKSKKISTLDKSLMDWNSHINSQESQGIRHDLEANRRGGGYLEKVEFMERVSERREEERKGSSSKRRRP